MNPQNKTTTEKFIANARAIHGDKFDYSKVEFIDRNTKVCIICPAHGETWITPRYHLSGCGCRQCAYEARNFPTKLTTESFVSKAKSVHGDKYDYSHAQYTSANALITIICPVHGIFNQRASGHLWGYGCPKCANEQLRKKVYGVGIKDITCSNTKYYKLWKQIIRRCYCADSFITDPAYIGCSVCEEWLLLSNFKAWFENPENGYKEGYHIDKDLLVKGNRIYSPKTCCFLPIELNSLLTTRRNYRGSYPIGVSKKNSKYQVALSTFQEKSKYLGVYDTPEEAFTVYKDAKEKYVKELAEKYFKEGKITERVYNALMKYEVEITD